MTTLRAVVIGAGWAGEGHTLALRHVGVEVMALCARRQEVVQAVAHRLAVPEASTDWRETLTRVKPDLVTLATTPSLRSAVVDVAADLGIHVLGEKPLATTAEEARRMYHRAVKAGIKHAYAATLRYEPSVVWLGELARSGSVGTVRSIEGSFTFGLPPLSPWGWWDRLETGGGALNNGFTHVLGVLATITGGTLRQAMGDARVVRVTAPFVGDIHDVRVLFRPEEFPTADHAATLEWRSCDADGVYSVLLTYSFEGSEVPVSVVQRPVVAASWPLDGWRIYGDDGTLVAEGSAIYRLSSPEGERELLPVPQRLLEQVPSVGDDGGSTLWAALARDFVADIQDEPHQPYLTFYEGWRFQEAIDVIRSGRSWFAVPD